MEKKDQRKSLAAIAVVALIVVGVIAYSVIKNDSRPLSAPVGPDLAGIQSGMVPERLEDIQNGPVMPPEKPSVYDGRGGFVDPGEGGGVVIGATDLSPEELRAQVVLRLASLKTQLTSLLEKYQEQEVDAQTVSRRLSEIAAELTVLQGMDFSSPLVRHSAATALERTATDLRTMSAEEAARAAERARTFSTLLELRVKLLQLSDRMAEWKRVSPDLFLASAR